MIALMVLNGSKTPKNACIPTLGTVDSKNRVPDRKFDDYDDQSCHCFLGPLGPKMPKSDFLGVSDGVGQKKNDSFDGRKRLKNT